MTLRLILSLMLTLQLSSCSTVEIVEPKHEDPYIQSEYGLSCKSHAYIKTVLSEYITTRFPSGAPVRMAIVPFSTPANLAEQSSEHPGLGNLLAQQVQARFLEAGEVPIVEIFNRQDWPGKKDEFYTGNFGAIAFARDAGYDLVLVGLLKSPKQINQLAAEAKIIETESGVTVWYGESEGRSEEQKWDRMMAKLGLSTVQPSQLHIDKTADQVARCMVRDMLSEF